MKILVDMNLSPHWVEFLFESGFPATHWSSVGASNAADGDIMSFAKAHEYVVMTQDLDFSAILAALNGTKPSVAQIRADNPNPDVIGQRVIWALRSMASELEQGALLTIDTLRIRLRVLPFDTQA